MLKDNLTRARKKSGLTQETVAAKLNITRQTLSAWERGLSVPDAESLEKLAAVYDVSVFELLGSGTADKEDRENDAQAAIASQLSRINEELAERNRRSHRIWRTLAIALFAVITAVCLVTAFNIVVIDGNRTVTLSLIIVLLAIPVTAAVLLFRK